MRKTIIYFGILIGTLGLTYSCENADEFLDKKPLVEFPAEDVWNDINLVEPFVNGMYKNALGWPFAIERLSDYVDESHFTPDWDVTNFNKSLITQDNLLGWQSGNSPHTQHLRWAPLYLNVRRTNIFFNRISDVPVADEKEQLFKDRLKGEVYFMRGYTYFMLTNLYGGVPLITKVYELDDDFLVGRNSYEECIDFIVTQLDSAALFLPEKMTDADLGRVTKGAAMAMKARVLLYAASDLHHQMNTYAPGFTNPELLGFTSGSQQNRWRAAKDAAIDVMDLGIYDLYKKEPLASDSIAKNFVDYFTTVGETEEDILLQYFSAKNKDEGWQYYNPALYCGPNGYHNWGNNCPLGDLVDDYEMADGSQFDWSNPVHQADPYANRDQRLYATILYEGVQWRTRPSDGLLIDPFSKLQAGAVYNVADTTVPLVPGLDTRQGPIEDWNGGYTGYYVRKFVDPTLDPQYVAQTVPFRHIRYAEVLLNYAEASIELGEYDDAFDAINQIRKRAGQPDLDPSITAEDLKAKYRNERRIELAYEDHRFWDVRRWVIGPEAYHQTHGVAVKYFVEVTNDDTDFTRFFVPPTNYSGNRPADKYLRSDGTLHVIPTYTRRPNPAGDQRTWLDKCYFFPIMRDEMGRNELLIQNPGY